MSLSLKEQLKKDRHDNMILRNKIALIEEIYDPGKRVVKSKKIKRRWWHRKSKVQPVQPIFFNAEAFEKGVLNSVISVNELRFAMGLLGTRFTEVNWSMREFNSRLKYGMAIEVERRQGLAYVRRAGIQMRKDMGLKPEYSPGAMKIKKQLYSKE